MSILKEFQRRVLLEECRSYYKYLCNTILYIQEPKESFNRWLMYQNNTGLNLPPKTPIELVEETNIYSEIMEDFPIKVSLFEKTIEGAEKSITDYYNAGNHLLSRTGENDFIRQKLNEVNDLKKMKKYNRVHIDMMNGLIKIKKECDSYYAKIMNHYVVDVCEKLFELSNTYHNRMLEESVNIDINVTVKELKGKKILKATYGDAETECKINISHYDRLKRLYTGDSFLVSLFCLLYRYETVFSSWSAGGLHMSIPHEVFDVLNKDLGVDTEIYASPFNSYFDKYHSIFPDIDSLFGSLGRAFEPLPTIGSFEANPPFEEKVMENMRLKIEQSLSESEDPLSFTVALPDWTNFITTTELRRSKWFKREIRLKKFKHFYVSGFQHKDDESQKKVSAYNDTIIIVLQNIEGSKRYKVTDKIVRNITSAFS